MSAENIATSSGWLHLGLVGHHIGLGMEQGLDGHLVSLGTWLIWLRTGPGIGHATWLGRQPHQPQHRRPRGHLVSLSIEQVLKGCHIGLEQGLEPSLEGHHISLSMEGFGTGLETWLGRPTGQSQFGTVLKRALDTPLSLLPKRQHTRSLVRKQVESRGPIFSGLDNWSQVHGQGLAHGSGTGFGRSGRPPYWHLHATWLGRLPHQPQCGIGL